MSKDFNRLLDELTAVADAIEIDPEGFYPEDILTERDALIDAVDDLGFVTPAKRRLLNEQIERLNAAAEQG